MTARLDQLRPSIRLLLSCFTKVVQQCKSLTGLLQNERKPDHFGGVFTLNDDPQKKPDKDAEKKVKSVLDRLRHYGIDNIVESNVKYALRAQSSQGDPEAAFRLLMLLEDTYEGIVRPYTPDQKLLGAINREGVTCYLDALLFAMFARLDSFEAMLYDNFDDAKRKRLAGLLRLWVNMLRTGRLITTDITERLQQAMADCGWADAERLRQQDPSEAFTFITGQLELPMLTLKMDMHHAGKEDPQDDHKFVNERLLEVAILDQPSEGNCVVTLEDCLEHYFNNRIEVKRHMENQRRNTLKSAPSTNSITKVEKGSAAHIEVVEVLETPTTETPNSTFSRVDQLRPTMGRKRADSIFSQRKVELTGIDPEQLNADTSNLAPMRKMSTRTEVLMPAWQFFKLLPWYADNMPTSDAQVAAHFSKKRPVLGICLKRYSYTNTGQAQRLDTYVDIPLEIAVPNFVSDDAMHEEGPLVGNFRLVLQSVVCHRGVSVNSGHYVCLCRGRAGNAQNQLGPNGRKGSQGSIDSEDTEDMWMRFDDLAKERVSYINIHQALKDEMPYLLFYQMQPIGEDGHSIHELPSYTEATSRSQSDSAPPEKPYLSEPPLSETILDHTFSEPTATVGRMSTDVNDFAPASERTSLDATTLLDPPRGRPDAPDAQERRKSITFDTSSFSGTEPNSNSLPSTPSEEKGNSLLSVATKINSRRGSRVSKSSATSRSRPPSTGPVENNNRFSLNMTKLTQRMSRNDMADSAPAMQPSEHVAAELAGQRSAEKPSSTTANVVSSSAYPSRENVNAVKTLTKSRKEKGTARHEKRKGQKGEDRDCAVM